MYFVLEHAISVWDFTTFDVYVRSSPIPVRFSFRLLTSSRNADSLRLFLLPPVFSPPVLLPSISISVIAESCGRRDETDANRACAVWFPSSAACMDGGEGGGGRGR